MWLHASNRQDENNVFERIFVLYKKGALERKTRKVFSDSPQWDGFLKVLSVSDLKIPLSYCGGNANKHRTQWELTMQKWKMVTKSRSRVI